MTQLLIGTIVESEYELAKEVVQQSFLTEAQSNGKEFELIGKIRKCFSFNISQ